MHRLPISLSLPLFIRFCPSLLSPIISAAGGGRHSPGMMLFFLNSEPRTAARSGCSAPGTAHQDPLVSSGSKPCCWWRYICLKQKPDIPSAPWFTSAAFNVNSSIFLFVLFLIWHSNSLSLYPPAFILAAGAGLTAATERDWFLPGAAARKTNPSQAVRPPAQFEETRG